MMHCALCIMNYTSGGWSLENRYHSVRLDVSRCRGCTNCLKHCPTEAIRIRDGRAADARAVMERHISRSMENILIRYEA